MPKTYRINLTETQRHELEVARDTHSFAYVRERAAAILKVASGWSLRQVAYVGLLKRHAPETVKEWCERYLAEGLSGLLVREAPRGYPGRKPCFFPAE